MFRSRLLIDRRIFQIRRTRNDSPTGDVENSREQTTKGEWHVTDGNNNINLRAKASNNFDFMEPFNVDEDVDSFESMKIRNWKYHLTNNKF